MLFIMFQLRTTSIGCTTNLKNKQKNKREKGKRKKKKKKKGKKIVSHRIKEPSLWSLGGPTGDCPLLVVISRGFMIHFTYGGYET